MNPEFWQEAWQTDKTGFNQDQPNPLLIKHFGGLDLPAGSRVFVPLCGKSIDMVWLAEQEYDVVGVELVEQAVRDFFTTYDIKPVIHQPITTINLKRYEGHYKTQKITLWVGDIFDLTCAFVGNIDSIYDRASLVALPDESPEYLRTAYTQQLINLGDTAPQLLLTFAFDIPRPDSLPPFAISSKQIEQYYGEHYHLEGVDCQPDPEVIKGCSGHHLAWRLMSKR